jgi:hypothetical protein
VVKGDKISLCGKKPPALCKGDTGLSKIDGEQELFSHEVKLPTFTYTKRSIKFWYMIAAADLQWKANHWSVRCSSTEIAGRNQQSKPIGSGIRFSQLRYNVCRKFKRFTIPVLIWQNVKGATMPIIKSISSQQMDRDIMSLCHEQDSGLSLQT